MKTYAIVLGAVLLAGCATYQPQPKPEWRLVDGAWIGASTTYQAGSEPGHITCNDIRYEWACNIDSYHRAIEEAARSINGMRR